MSGQLGADPRGATGTGGIEPASTPGIVGTMPDGTANLSRPGVTNGSAIPSAVDPVDGAAVVSGAFPRGATGTDCGGMGSGPGEVGAGTVTFGAAANCAGGVTGWDSPAAVAADEVTAVVSGTFPRGATWVTCGGLSGPGRLLAANSWLASAASSAALIGRSPSASTDLYSLVLMELVHRDVLEHGERVIGQHGK